MEDTELQQGPPTKYLYNGKVVPESDVEGAAKESGYDVQTYLQKTGMTPLYDNYTYKGKQVPLNDILGAAKQSGYDVQTYLQKTGMTPFDDSQTQQPQQPAQQPVQQPVQQQPQQPQQPVGDPIEMSKEAAKLANQTSVQNTPTMTGGMTMGTTSSEVVPDQNAVKQSEDLKQQIKQQGYDPDQLNKLFSDVPDNWYSLPGFSKPELLQGLQTNPNGTVRDVASMKWINGLNNVIASSNMLDDQKQIYKNEILTSGADANYADKRRDNQSIVNLINSYVTDPAEKEKLQSNLAIDRSFTYGQAASNPAITEGDPLSKTLNNYQLAAWNYIKDLFPEKADGYAAAFVDPKNIKNDPDAELGREEKLKKLDQLGTDLSVSYATEKLAPIQAQYKQLLALQSQRPLTPQEFAQMKSLEQQGTPYQDILNVAQKHNDDMASAYPNLNYMESDNMAQELLGQKHGFAANSALTLGAAGENTVMGLVDLVRTPFQTDQQNAQMMAHIAGNDMMNDNSTYTTQGNQEINNLKPVVDPQLQSQIDAIKNNASLSDDDKRQQVDSLLMQNRNKWQLKPIDPKDNLTLRSISYGVSHAVANLVPFYLASEGFGALGSKLIGGANAQGINQFTSNFNAAVASSLQEEVAKGIEDGEPHPLAHALRVTGINGLFVAPLDLPEKLNNLAISENTGVKKVLEKMSDDALADKLHTTPGVINGLKYVYDIGQDVFDKMKEGGKLGLKVSAATTGGELVNDIISGKVQKPQDYAKQFAVSTLNFGLLGGILGTAGKLFNKQEPLRGSTILDVGSHPEPYLNALDQMVANGSMDKGKADQIRNNINVAAEVRNKVPMVDDEGNALSDEAQRRVMLLKMQQHALTDLSKQDIPTKLMPKVEKALADNQEQIDEATKPEIVGKHGDTNIISTTSAQDFHDAISAAVNARKADRLQVDVHPVEDYKEILDNGGKLYLSENKKFGGFVLKDGYMGSLFKHPEANTAGVAKTMQQLIVKDGGRFFDAFGTHLESIYMKNGFRPVARLKFNEEYAPEGWEDSNLKDKPDVVFFAYDPNGKYKAGDGKYFDNWDEAYNFTKQFSKDNEQNISGQGSELSTKNVVNGQNVSEEETNNPAESGTEPAESGTEPAESGTVEPTPEQIQKAEKLSPDDQDEIINNNGLTKDNIDDHKDLFDNEEEYNTVKQYLNESGRNIAEPEPTGQGGAGDDSNPETGVTGEKVEGTEAENPSNASTENPETETDNTAPAEGESKELIAFARSNSYPAFRDIHPEKSVDEYNRLRASDVNIPSGELRDLSNKYREEQQKDLYTKAGFTAPFVNELFEHDINPLARKLGTSFKEAVTGVVNALSPKTGVAEKAITSLMNLMGDRHAAEAAVDKMLDGFEKIFDRMKDAGRIDFVDRMKTGRKQLTSQLQVIADVLKKLDKEWLYDPLKEIHPSLEWKEHHYRVLWQTVPGTEKQATNWNFTRMSRRPLAGSSGFLRQATLADMSEGIAKGGVPFTTNPIRMFKAAYADGMKFITANRMFDALKDDKMIQFVKTGQRAPDFFVPINDKIAKKWFRTDKGLVKAGEYYIEEGAGRILNNHLSNDIFREKGTPIGAVGRGLMEVKNLYTTAELSLSGFHAVAESMETVSSTLGLAYRKLVNLGIRGNFDAVKSGIMDILKSPFSPATTFVEGRSAIKFASAKDFENSEMGKRWLAKTPDAAQYLTDFFHGGGLLKQSADLRANTFKALKEHAGKNNYIGAALRALPALNETLLNPLFDTYIPALKVGMFFKEFPVLLKENEGRLNKGTVTREQLARKQVDFIDDRLGEMNFDNLFWNRSFKTAMQFFFRSVTWKLGNMRAMLGAPVEQAKEFYDAAKERRAPMLMPKMAWLFGLSTMQVALAQVINKLFANKDIKTFKDIVAPQINPDDPNERVMLPTYYKDLMHMAHDPTGYLTTSMSGPLSKLAQIHENRDFYNYQIYEPNDPALDKMKDALLYFIPKPFSFSSASQMIQKGEPPAKVALSFFGLNKAPGYLTHTDLENKIFDLYNIYNIEVHPKSEKEAKAIKTQIRSQYKSGDIEGAEKAANEAVKDGKLRPSQIKYLFSHVGNSESPTKYFFSELPFSDKVYLYKQMNDDEKKFYDPNGKLKAYAEQQK